MSKDVVNIPKASTLMGSLRSMGYTFESAIADIIDNSISAQATVVKVLFPTNPLDKIAVGIIDDGKGMTNAELFEAMRYGSMAYEDIRDGDDLGRFGMGMKAASLSQCRNLTVVSYDKNKNISAYAWDYVYIQKKQDWVVQELTSAEIEELPYIESLKERQKGTLVLWQDFDVLSKSSGGQVYDTLVDLRKPLENALALIFHRFLSSANEKLEIFINNQSVKPLDPFLENHKKTTSKKERTIDIKDSKGKEQLIRIKPFILPYATDMNENDKKLVGGIENLRSKQGFYVYRNKRLIIWGTWFGMKHRAELTKNARIRVDIPNTLDDIWGIDIKKQQASIPKRILHQLTQTVNDALELSVNQQTYRGRTVKVDDDADYIWNRKAGRNQTFFYQINRESKLFQFVKEKMSDTDYDYLEMLVTEIERNIPTQQMYVDKCNEAISVEEDDHRFDDVYQIAITMALSLKSVGHQSYAEIIDSLMKSEPFCKYPQLKNKLIDNFKDYYD